jgi:hypothetical protein
MLENVDLARRYFPDWKVYVYYAPDVTETMVARLSACSNVVLIPTGVAGPINMIRRFYAIDEPGVDLMMVRDADSRIHWKDRWAIGRFVASDRGAHIIRDHREHGAPILAGLWGLRAGVLPRPIRELVADWTPVAGGSGDVNDPSGFGVDQNFLKLVVYPLLTDHSLVHFSFNCLYAGEHAEMFPFEWSNDIYCGRVEELEPASPSSFVPRQSPRRTLDFLPKK